MFTAMKDLRKALLFTGLVLLLAVLFSVMPGMNSFVYMLTPTIATLLMMLVFTREGYTKEGWRKLGLHKLGLNGWLYALLVPMIPLGLGFGFVWISGLSSLVIPDNFEGFSWGSFPLLVVFLYVKTVLTNSLGEELGWRGYLLPNMLGLGEKKAMLLNGFIHGIWHFPLIMFTDQYHSGENLWLLVPLTIASTVFLGPVIGTLRLRTGSVWTASMLHTTHNLVWYILAALTVHHSRTATYIAGDMAIFIVAFYAGLTWLMWGRKKPRLAS